MKDFETHPRGTIRELEYSRALAREIEQTINQYGNVLPYNVITAYNKLNDYYKIQIEMEKQ
jgi:hypothetical protein